jgi:chaperone BCS1
MKITVVRASSNFHMIMKYLHHHMDNTYNRELSGTFMGTLELELGIDEQKFTWNEIKFTLYKNDVYKKNYDDFYKYTELVMEHESLTVLEMFITDCLRFEQKQMKYTKPVIFRSNYNLWDYEAEIQVKDISKIYLPIDIKENVIKDLTNFTDQKVIQRYTELNINHTRMYMFYGPPGTGKTSLIKALACYFKKHICYLNINSDLKDEQLKKCIQNLPYNSLLCLEDADSLFGEDRVRKTGLTFSGFINTLDGFATPKNLIVIMTTNTLSKLDTAVIRRISYFIEFKYAVRDQIKSMFDTFFPESDFNSFYNNVKGTKITINILEKFFTRYLFDDIIEQSKNFSKFINGELHMEVSHIEKLYI